MLTKSERENLKKIAALLDRERKVKEDKKTKKDAHNNINFEYL